jgi:hypothetical protein
MTRPAGGSHVNASASAPTRVDPSAVSGRIRVTVSALCRSALARRTSRGTGRAAHVDSDFGVAPARAPARARRSTVTRRADLVASRVASQALSSTDKSSREALPWTILGTSSTSVACGQVSRDPLEQTLDSVCQGSCSRPRASIEYLGRYVHRTALTDKAILHCDDKSVTFAYRDSRDHRRKTMTLDAHEFLRRFLQHVSPRALHRVRAFGLLHSSKRGTLRRLQLLLKSAVPPRAESETTQRRSRRCPHCGTGMKWTPSFRPLAGRVKVEAAPV